MSKSQVVVLKLLKHYQTDTDWLRVLWRNISILSLEMYLSMFFLIGTKWSKPNNASKHLTYLAHFLLPANISTVTCDARGVRGPINKYRFLFSRWLINTGAQKPLNRTLCHICAHFETITFHSCALALDLRLSGSCVDVLRQLWVTFDTCSALMLYSRKCDICYIMSIRRAYSLQARV